MTAPAPRGHHSTDPQTPHWATKEQAEASDSHVRREHPAERHQVRLTTKEAPGLYGTRGTQEAFRSSTTTISQPSEYVAHFVMRMLQDALDSATAEFWVKRATDFESARPKPGEFHGRATPAELNERDRRCREQAQACRDHAQILASMEFNDISADVVDVLLEVV